MPSIIIVKSQKPKNKRLLKVARDQNSVLYICVSFSVLHIGLSLPSFKTPYICISILYLCLSFWLTSLCIMGSSFIYLIRNRSPAQVGCLRQSAQSRCTGNTQRDGMGREVGGGIGMGNTCKSMADSCQCMGKTTTIL